MNNNIKHLAHIATKPKRVIIGLMSGTSLDGLDIALCSIEGSGLDTNLTLLQFETIGYTDDFKTEVKSIFAKRNIDLEKLCLLNSWIATQHANMINTCLKKWNVNNKEVDLIASHGQTIFHAPQRLHQQQKFSNATLQIGDGDHLAVATGITTISDFRQKHIAAGGEGAPLAVYGDYVLFSKKGEDRILLNMGGIANFTYLPGSLNATELICTDVGPGNTLLDAVVQQYFPDKHFDENAILASKGMVNDNLLHALLQHHFFTQSFPKSTGPELFNLTYLENAKQKSNTSTLSAEDTLATLTKFSATAIAKSITECMKDKNEIKIFSSGGGIHNPLLISFLKQLLPNCSFHTTAALGIHPDAKEAVLFAVLANECIAGDPTLFKSKNAAMPAVSFGKISFAE